MNLKMNMGVLRSYLSLIIYFVIVLVFTSGGATLLVLGIAGGVFLLLYLHRLTSDDSFFYAYIFLAMLAVLVPLAYASKISTAHIAFMYGALLPLFYHFVIVRFGDYKKVHRITFISYLSAPILSFLSVYLLFYFPLNFGFYATVALIFIVVLLYYPLSSVNS